MASQKHLDLLRQGTKVWNKWRERNPASLPDLSGAILVGADLVGVDLVGVNLITADFSGANLSNANLIEAKLIGAYFVGANLSGALLSRANLETANLKGANLSKADLSYATLHGANLHGAILVGANLIEANLGRANLSKANLSGANLSETQLIKTDISGADLTGSLIYGIAAWDVTLTGDTRQENLIITPPDEPVIMVDNIKVAQFIYLLLNNKEVRDVIGTITSKAVLILGRFSPKRKIILDRLREELRTRHYVPIMFDFKKPKSRDTIETIRILAGMSKFIIADLTEAKAVIQELQAIVPNFPSVPVRFIIKKSEREPGMFDHIRRYPWVLDGAFEYKNPKEVVQSINDNILDPVEAKLRELSQ
jgi:Pentapeptide repeats (8 copies)